MSLKVTGRHTPVFYTQTVFLLSDVLKELVLLSPHDFLHTLVPFLQHNHCTYHHSNMPSMYSSSPVLEYGWHLIFLHTETWRLIFFHLFLLYTFNVLVSLGPYFPCRENIKLIGGKSNIRPPRPELNMCLLPTMVETSKVCWDARKTMFL